MLRVVLCTKYYSSSVTLFTLGCILPPSPHGHGQGRISAVHKKVMNLMLHLIHVIKSLLGFLLFILTIAILLSSLTSCVAINTRSGGQSALLGLLVHGVVFNFLKDKTVYFKLKSQYINRK